jgi:gliding motility-associated lipoprotein GldH
MLAAMASATLLLTGCGGSLASANISPDDACWAIEDSLLLSYDVEEPGMYQLVFPITFTESYPYQNLYLHVKVTTPSGKVTAAPYNYVLMDEYGVWYEKPKGDKISFELPLGRNIRLDEKGTYSFSICHYMRNEHLCGIASASAEVRNEVN